MTSYAAFNGPTRVCVRVGNTIIMIVIKAQLLAVRESGAKEMY